MLEERIEPSPCDEVHVEPEARELPLDGTWFETTTTFEVTSTGLCPCDDEANIADGVWEVLDAPDEKLLPIVESRLGLKAWLEEAADKLGSCDEDTTADDSWRLLVIPKTDEVPVGNGDEDIKEDENTKRDVDIIGDDIWELPVNPKTDELPVGTGKLELKATLEEPRAEFSVWYEVVAVETG
ncbi:hypothetical protein BT63DRAFT_456227 [Microthyrium microscopicum]|uniref:Uncharacterized protein n=1 Tax=Microthyrium microscopicum TaxID=703497 RepID=A0A6A6UCC6_9PEZI|nr:hypothetical protein BT63DRAFT_456227 [Microthyrium microscopicum]